MSTLKKPTTKAHGITRVGLAKVGGAHLSDAANEPVDGAVATSDWPMPAPRAFDEAFFARVDEAVLRDKQADGWNVRNDERAMRDQVKLQGLGL
jgi:hypothetical protein